jgi:hypothetical protein
LSFCWYGIIHFIFLF